MTKRLLFLFMLVSVLPSGQSWAQDNQTYLLRHVFAPGMSATNEISIQLNGTMKMEQAPTFPYDATVNLVMPVNVLESTEENTSRLELRVRELSNEQRLGYEVQKLLVRPGWMSVDDEIVFDRRTNPGPHPFQELLGTKVFITISPRGELKDFSSLDQLAGMIPNADLPSQMAHGFVVFPEQPIKVGEAWRETNEMFLATNTKPVDSKTEYVLLRVDPNDRGEPVAIIGVKRSAESDKVVIDGKLPSQPNPEPGQINVRKLVVKKMKQSFQGVIYFDIKKGRVLRTE
ncbi:MAG TPA: hypothetical protein PKH07_16990, partial [bacterium]|nr:hypothetical protein [bacterium]